MRNYLDITVVISPGTAGTYAVRVESSQGGQGHSTLKLPFKLADLAETVFGVSETTRDLGRPQPAVEVTTSTKSAADFGVELFEALFQGEARDVLVATDSQAQGRENTGVRIRLSMDLQGPGMAEVASLPWELMCRKGQRPLALSNQTPLVRSLDAPRSTDLRPFSGTLRIMALMSNPKGTEPLNMSEERTRIEQSWARLKGVEVDFVRPVRAEILKQLAAVDYHVIHYMGHGEFDDADGGMLAMELEDGSLDPVTGDVFAMWLADEPLRLVFLNACKSGTTSMRSGVHPFAGVATALIRERLPAVVAMQFPISDQAAIAFSRTFYERIAQGFPVDAAVTEGRKELYSSKQAEWATPVLYLRAKDGMLFTPSNDVAVLVTPVNEPASSSAAAATPAAADDAWGPDAEGALRVFIATPDQNLEKRHAQLSRALKTLDWIRVVDTVPKDDVEQHAAAVDRLVRRADLSVHLLGASPGQRLDDDDRPDTLKTFQLEQLRIGLEAARSQLVVMTSEDKESIGNESYAAKVRELGDLPREKARFELVITDKNRIADAVVAKLQKMKEAREAALAPAITDGTVRTAFVDSHDVDQDRANDLVTFLSEHNVEAFMQTSDGSATAELAQFADNLKKYPLYIIVAGGADEAWVKYRTNAARTSAVKARAAILIGKYDGADGGNVTMSRLKVVAAIKRMAPDPIETLFAPAPPAKP
jgi:hypothetical protein